VGGRETRRGLTSSDVKLIENNARIGSQVAREVARLFKDASSSAYSGSSSSRPKSYFASPSSSSLAFTSTSTLSEPDTNANATALARPDSSGRPPLSGSQPNTNKLPSPTVMVIGSAAIDLTSLSPHELAPGTTTPGTVYLSPGGVGRNIAEAAQNLLPPHTVQLVSPYGLESGRAHSEPMDARQGSTGSGGVAREESGKKELGEGRGRLADREADVFGKVLMMEMRAAGMRVDGLVQSGERATAVCSLVLERRGDLVAGVADMGIVETLEEDVVSPRIVPTWILGGYSG
jgi:pseudouridine-5'-phosphate glycosidase/pseudouridine kinase